MKCTIRADALNSHVYPVRMEMNGTKKITISYFCFTNKSTLEEFLVEKLKKHQKTSSSIKVLRRTVNHNSSIKTKQKKRRKD